MGEPSGLGDLHEIGFPGQVAFFSILILPGLPWPWAGYEVESSSGWGASSEAASDRGLVEFFSPASCGPGFAAISGNTSG